MISNGLGGLGKIGLSEEAESYISLYRKIEPHRFAVIKISGACLGDDSSLDAIAQDLSDLYGFGLIPTITYGWGKTLTSRLEAQGIESRFVDGNRYTDGRVMPHVEAIAVEMAEKLSKAIDSRIGSRISSRRGKTAVIDYNSGVFIGEDKKDSGYGENNGDIVAVNTDKIIEAINAGYIPIISPIAVAEDRRKRFNINAADSGACLAAKIDPIKFLMLTGSRGVLNNNNKTIEEIVLSRDYDRLKKDDILSGGMLKNVDEAYLCLNARPNGDDRSVQIVNPGNIIHELFTRKGAGTYIRKGYEIERMPLVQSDTQAVKQIMEKSFGDELVDDYFNRGRDEQIYIEKNRKGAATVAYVNGAACLRVFAVLPEYQGNGLGKDLFAAVSSDNPKLFWRSQPHRKATSFYIDVSDAHRKYTGEDGKLYYFYQKGLGWEEEKYAADFMKRMPSNFKN